MNILISSLIIIGIGSLVNKLIKVNNVKKKDNQDINEEENAQIEKGFPTGNSSALHMNSTIEPPIPNTNYYTGNYEFQYEDEKDNTKQIYTKNMFVESHYELGISLFEKELTKQIVIDAYENLLNENIDNIRRDTPDVFNINDKKEARDYLLAYLSKYKDRKSS